MTGRSTVRCVALPDEEYKKLRDKIASLKHINAQNQLLLEKYKHCKCDFNIEDDTLNIDKNTENERNQHPVLSQAPVFVEPQLGAGELENNKSLADSIDYEVVFGKNQRRNARIIANALEQAFKWNKQGELFDNFNGDHLSRSNVLHIIGFLLNTFNYKPEDIPEKIERVILTLKEKTNLPANVIKNKNARQLYVKEKGTLSKKRRVDLSDLYFNKSNTFENVRGRGRGRGRGRARGSNNFSRFVHNNQLFNLFGNKQGGGFLTGWQTMK